MKIYILELIKVLPKLIATIFFCMLIIWFGQAIVSPIAIKIIDESTAQELIGYIKWICFYILVMVIGNCIITFAIWAYKNYD